MDFYVNLNGGAVTLALTDTAHLAAVQEVTGGQDQELRIKSHRDGTPELLPTGGVPTFEIKANGNFEGPALVVANESDFSVPGSPDGFYVATVSFDTTGIRTALHVNGTTGDDVDAIQGAMGEVSWQPTGATRPTRSLRIPYQINNWINHGTEVATDAVLDLASRVSVLEDEVTALETAGTAVAALTVLTGVTGYTGGTSANLDGAVVPTTAVAVGHIYLFVNGTDHLPKMYEVVAGTDAEAAPGVVRPDDYNAVTNAKVLKQRL